MQSEATLRDEIVKVARRMHQHGLVAATDGNVSYRLDDGGFLVTRSGLCLGEATVDDIVRLNSACQVIEGGKPTSELAVHLTVYRIRDDVRSVVHAHPTYANALTFAGVSMDELVIPEVVLTLGRIPTTEYGTPACPEGAEVIAPHIVEHDAVLLQRHGSVTVGRTATEAYLKLEKVEHAAHILYLARTLGGATPMNADELSRLAAVGKRLGIDLPPPLRGM